MSPFGNITTPTPYTFYIDTNILISGDFRKLEVKSKKKWVNPKFYHMKPILINPLKVPIIEMLFTKIRYHLRIIVPQIRYPWKAKKQKKQK